jgi:hypothetical protein
MAIGRCRPREGAPWYEVGHRPSAKIRSANATPAATRRSPHLRGIPDLGDDPALHQIPVQARGICHSHGNLDHRPAGMVSGWDRILRPRLELNEGEMKLPILTVARWTARIVGTLILLLIAGFCDWRGRAEPLHSVSKRDSPFRRHADDDRWTDRCFQMGRHRGRSDLGRVRVLQHRQPPYFDQHRVRADAVGGADLFGVRVVEGGNPLSKS